MREVKLEFIARLRQDGRVLAEYIIRGQVVECVAYWPSGEIRDHGTMSLDAFYEGVTKIQKEKSNA